MIVGGASSARFVASKDIYACGPWLLSVGSLPGTTAATSGQMKKTGVENQQGSKGQKGEGK